MNKEASIRLRRRERELGTNQGAAVLLFILTPYTLLHEWMRSLAVDVTGRSDRYGITNQALIRGTCPRDLPPIQNANVKHSQVIINRLSRFGSVSLFTFRVRCHWPEVSVKEEIEVRGRQGRKVDQLRLLNSDNSSQEEGLKEKAFLRAEEV